MSKNIDFKLVGNLLRLLRERIGIGQQELADELNVSKAAVCQWENGSGIKTEKIYEIAKYFDITVAELINGQLNDEEDEEFFQRNYDLSEHPDFEDINDENADDLFEYLERCSNVVRRIFKLSSLYFDNLSTKKQNEEFRRMIVYFETDWNYLGWNNYGIIATSIYEFVSELRDSIKPLDPYVLDYELSKVYKLKIEVNPISVLEYSDEAAKLYLSLLSKQHKDEMLTNYVENLSYDEIEKSIVVKRLLDNGARCLFTQKDVATYITYSPKDLERFEGVMKENISLNAIMECFNKKDASVDASFYKGENPYSWKAFSPFEYNKLINKEKTNDLLNIIKFKDTEPEEYYDYIVNRDKQKLL